MLEARDVPAAFYWNPLAGSDLLASTATNWVDGSGIRAMTAPGAADDLYFTGVEIPVTSTESLIFGAESFVVPPGSPPPPPPPPPVIAQANCYITSSDPNESIVRTYNGVHVMAGYTGTVDFKVSTFVGNLELRGGNIAQNDAFYASAGGGHLAVTVHFDWTAGILNSSSTAGWVHLVGATGIIDPGDGNTVGLGSTLSLEKNTSDLGADVTLGDGTIQGIGLPDIFVGEFCKLQRPAANLWLKLNQIGKVEMNGGEITLHCVESDSYLLINGGKVILKANGTGPALNTDTVIFKGRIGAQGPSVKIDGGTLELQCGVTLKANFGFEMANGALVTRPTTIAGGNNISLIRADAKISGGDISIGKPVEGNPVYATLTVDGDVTWTGGTYRPYINSTSNTFEATTWKASSTFYTTNGATITPDVQGAGNPLGKTWIVIEANKIQGTGDPSAGINWTVTKEGNPTKKMGVKGT